LNHHIIWNEGCPRKCRKALPKSNVSIPSRRQSTKDKKAKLAKKTK